MNNEIENRVRHEGEYILQNSGTVRSLAKVFGVSKSTVHFDLSFRLKKLDLDLFLKVRKILNINLQERHLRGGVATKKMYELKRKNSKKTTKIDKILN